MTHCEKPGCPRIARVEVLAQAGTETWIYGYFCQEHAGELAANGIDLRVGAEI